MLQFFDPFRDLSLLSVSLRLLLALLCGGVIGMEREFRRHKAGFRTHILICLGAAITTMTSQYLFLYLHLYTDIGRLGAQVIAGIGFIGAGCIVITTNRHVRGLTTAAGLWAAAIIGLTIGAGFYEGALCATFLVLFTELVLSRLESSLRRESDLINLYVTYRGSEHINSLLTCLEDQDVKLSGFKTAKFASDPKLFCALITLRLRKQSDLERLVRSLDQMDGISSVTRF